MNTSYHMNISVRTKRQAAGLSLSQLAEMSEVSRSYINDVEKCFKMPTIDVMCRLAKALGVRPEDLYECPESSAIEDK